MFVNNPNQIDKNLPGNIRLMTNKYWPGDLTIIYKQQAYRMPNNPLILKIIDDLGPLWSTSANISGKKPIKTIEEAMTVFKDNLSNLIIVRSNCVSIGINSTIYDYDNKKIIREGRIKINNLFS